LAYRLSFIYFAAGFAVTTVHCCATGVERVRGSFFGVFTELFLRMNFCSILYICSTPV